MSVELIGLSTAPATSGVTRRAPNLAGAVRVVVRTPSGSVLGDALQQRQGAHDGLELGGGQLVHQRLGEPFLAVLEDAAHGVGAGCRTG